MRRPRSPRRTGLSLAEDYLGRGIYLVDVSTTPAQVKVFDFATKKSKNITHLDLGPRMPPQGFDMSPDEKWILYTRVDELDSDIILVENFR